MSDEWATSALLILTAEDVATARSVIASHPDRESRATLRAVWESHEALRAENERLYRALNRIESTALAAECREIARGAGLRVVRNGNRVDISIDTPRDES